MVTIMQAAPSARNGQERAVQRGAATALCLLLAINLFNYIDRQVLSAVLPKLALDASLFAPDDPNLRRKLGYLTSAFLISYMLLSPVFGWLGDTRSRWRLVGAAVIVWSLASGGSGLATSFLMLLLTRCLVGIGEAAYGPVAPSMLSDMYPERDRGKIMARFYLAIPVGSALGFVIGGQVAGTSLGWRGAFLVVVIPGLLLGALCFFMTDPPRTEAQKAERHKLRDYWNVLRRIWRVRSFRANTTAMTAWTFMMGGVAAFAPMYIFEREARFQLTPAALDKLADLKNTQGVPVVAPQVIEKLKQIDRERIFTATELRGELTKTLTDQELRQYNLTIFDNVAAPGSINLEAINVRFGIIVVASGLFATLLGGWLGDRLRVRIPGAYFLVAGGGCLVSLPFFLAMLYVPFPAAWFLMFAAVFCLFLNTGPANTILANVVPSHLRATSFAINILIIHALGDVISPPIIGAIGDDSSLHTAFLVMSAFVLAAGVMWSLGARHLERDTRNAESV
jgi:MFS family permease